MELSPYAKGILAEQVKVSAAKIEELKDDQTIQGQKEFDHHVGIINDIKNRVEIIQNSEKNRKEIDETLKNLW